MQGARGQIHQIDDHDDYLPYDRGYGEDDDFRTPDDELEQEDEPAVSRNDDQETSWPFGALLGALSGTIVGFFLAGAFDLAVVTFVALAVGGILGWIARGIAQ